MLGDKWLNKWPESESNNVSTLRILGGGTRALVPRHDCGSVIIGEPVDGPEMKLNELGKTNLDQDIWEKASRVQVAKSKKKDIFTVNGESNHKIDWE